MVLSPRHVIGCVLGGVVGFLVVSRLDAPPSLQDAPAPVLAPGEVRAAPAGKGFSVVLPKGWVRIDPQAPEFQAAFREGMGKMKGLGELAAKFDPAHTALYAVDPQTAGQPLPRTVNVVVTGRAGSGSPEEAARKLSEALKANLPGLNVLGAGTAELPVGKVARVVSSIAFPAPNGGQVRSTTVSYSLPDGDRTFSLTVTGSEADRAAVESLGETIAKTFRAVR